MKHLYCLGCALSLLALSACHPDHGDDDEDGGNNDSPTIEEPQLPASFNFKSIRGGSFTMGGNTSANDAPQTRVTISDFSLSETEVTNRQYLAFLNDALERDLVLVNEVGISNGCLNNARYDQVLGTGDAQYSGEIYIRLAEQGGCVDNRSEHDDNRSWIRYDAADDAFELVDTDKANWPVNWVSWHGAAAFADFYSVSLPTEAQWEFAAGGGQDDNYPTDDGAIAETKANYSSNNGNFDEDDRIVEVETYGENPFGLFDMAGNVWEWCKDYYDEDYYGTDTSDPENTVANTNEARVRRGGAWNTDDEALQTHVRSFAEDTLLSSSMGFRIVNSQE